jgi:hypothetical protein
MVGPSPQDSDRGCRVTTAVPAGVSLPEHQYADGLEQRSVRTDGRRCHPCARTEASPMFPVAQFRDAVNMPYL